MDIAFYSHYFFFVSCFEREIEKEEKRKKKMNAWIFTNIHHSLYPSCAKRVCLFKYSSLTAAALAETGVRRPPSPRKKKEEKENPKI